MSSSEIQKTRVINELRGFIKKLLQDPKILEQAMEIARRQLAESRKDDVMARIANEISDTTSIHIPEDPADHSEADRLFLELLKEVSDEEQALY
jgi:tRNA uridine 5-carbamoylmethylation protein Kti12